MKRFLAMRLVALVFSFTFIVCSGFFTYASAQSNVKRLTQKVSFFVYKDSI